MSVYCFTARPPALRIGPPMRATLDHPRSVGRATLLTRRTCGLTQWAQLPKDLPPRSTVNGYFKCWEHDGTLARVHHALYVKCREMADRQASPTVGTHRQPKRQERRKRGRSIDPAG